MTMTINKWISEEYLNFTPSPIRFYSHPFFSFSHFPFSSRFSHCVLKMMLFVVFFSSFSPFGVENCCLFVNCSLCRTINKKKRIFFFLLGIFFVLHFLLLWVLADCCYKSCLAETQINEKRFDLVENYLVVKLKVIQFKLDPSKLGSTPRKLFHSSDRIFALPTIIGRSNRSNSSL